MKNIIGLLVLAALLVTLHVSAQVIDFSKASLTPVQVSMHHTTLDSMKVLRVTKDTAVKKDDEATFVRVNNTHFKDGTISVKVLSRLLPDAPALARGFIGLAFRINDSNNQFECIYIRPTNGRAEQQLRRNRSVQYFSFPDYKYDRLRTEAPGQYESYADMGLNEWIQLRIEVKGTQAKLFLNNNTQPTLVVNDLKHGAGSMGAIGLFVDVGTEGFFRDLKISNLD